MGASFSELRRVCQRPVRETNDVAGLIYGDFLSLPITKLMVDLRLSPTWASIGFLICGLAGAALSVGGGLIAIGGAALLVLYYVLDCVDGEVARWQRVCDVRWTYFDYLFHLLVKPLTFLGVGLGTFLGHGAPWLLVAAFSAAVATLWLKTFLEMAGIVFLKEFLRRPRKVEFIADSARPLVEQALGSANESVAPRAAPSSPFRLRLDLVTLRALMTNFDIGLLLLFAASVADAAVGPIAYGDATLGWRSLWLLYYGVVLPLDFADYVITYLRRGHFTREATRLLAIAHNFSLEPRAEQRVR